MIFIDCDKTGKDFVGILGNSPLQTIWLMVTDLRWTLEHTLRATGVYVSLFLKVALKVVKISLFLRGCHESASDISRP